MAKPGENLFRWRVLMQEGRKVGHIYLQPDLMIAATALHHRFTVITRDRDNFDKAGVTVINPWEEPQHRVVDPRLILEHSPPGDRPADQRVLCATNNSEGW